MRKPTMSTCVNHADYQVQTILYLKSQISELEKDKRVLKTAIMEMLECHSDVGISETDKQRMLSLAE